MSELVSEMTRAGALLDLLFTNREELMGDVVVGGCLEHNDHELIEFSIFDETRRSINKISQWASGGRTLASSGC